MIRTNPMTHIGFTVPERGTAGEVLTAAHLDWRVERVGLRLDDERGALAPDHRALVRSDSGGLLGIVGRGYTPIQNEAMFQTLTGLVDDGDAIFTHAGSTHGGRRIFAVMQLPDVWKLDRDPHVTQLLATTTHDGTGSLKIRPLATRLWCQNQINGLFWRQRSAAISIPHKTSAQRRVEALRAALGLSVAAMSEYEVVARNLLDVPVNTADVDRFLAELFPTPTQDSPRVEVIAERAQAARGLTREAYESERGANIAGTAFGLLQAAVDYSDWSAPVRAVNQSVRRAEKIVTGTDLAFKTRAYQLAAAL